MSIRSHKTEKTTWSRAFDIDGTPVAARVEGLDDDNPDPNDPSAKQEAIGLGHRAVKQKGGPLSVHAKAFSQTLLGRGFSRHGKGSVPVWNPSDDQDGTTSVKRAPVAGEEPGAIVVADTSNKAFADKIKNKVLQEGGAGGKYLENSGIGPDRCWNPGDEGGSGPQDNDGSHHKPGSPKPLSELGPKPEIVNPPTVKSLGGPDTKAARGSVPNATETNGARLGAREVVLTTRPRSSASTGPSRRPCGVTAGRRGRAVTGPTIGRARARWQERRPQRSSAKS